MVGTYVISSVFASGSLCYEIVALCRWQDRAFGILDRVAGLWDIQVQLESSARPALLKRPKCKLSLTST